MQKLAIVNPVDFVLAFGDKERYEDTFSFLDSTKNFNGLCADKCTSTTLDIKNSQFLQNVLAKLLDD